MADDRTALHEAAHAVVAILEGLDLKAASLEHSRCRVAAPQGWVRMSEEGAFTPRNPEDPRQRPWIAAHCRWLLAGSITAAHFGELQDDDSDMTQVAELVATLGLIDEEHEDLYVERLQRQTSRILAENWPAVQAVAEKLRERQALTAAQVR